MEANTYIPQLKAIASAFGMEMGEITAFYDTSHGEKDKRLNFIIESAYVIKINSQSVMTEHRLQEIRRVIERYLSIGVYCPRLLATPEGALSCLCEVEGEACIAFVEEYAAHPICPESVKLDRGEVVAHLGKLAARYTGVDLSDTRSMWSIIDLAPLDADVDEKQESANALVEALKKAGFPQLAERVGQYNEYLRVEILKDFAALPRCVFQGDLNGSNLLHRDGHFAGLIDFNMSGTDVNINVFVNETNWFPDEGEFDSMSLDEIAEAIEKKQTELLSSVLEHYILNQVEKRNLPYFKGICNLFQWPIVCDLTRWLQQEERREKATALIQRLSTFPQEKSPG